MVDLEGLSPPSAAASHRKVSCCHCGQVSCCFSLLIVLCLLCLLRFVYSFVSPLPLFALLTRPFFLSSLSLSCCLLVVAYSLAPDLGRLHSLAPVLGGAPSRSHSSASVVLLLGPIPRPRRCSCSIPYSAAAVLLLGPFLGLRGAPARSLPWPQRSWALQPHRVLLLGSSALPWCSAQTFCLASVLLLVSSALPWFSSSAPVLGTMTPCSARNLQAPHETFGLASVLLLGFSALPWFSSSVPFLGLGGAPRSRSSVLFLGGASLLHTKPLAVLRSSVLLLLLGSNWSHGAPHAHLSSPFLSLCAPIR
jgi:hypothetical protein